MFKTCLFGGFDREDVVSFIEKTSREARESIEALEQSNQILQQQNDEMSRELYAIKGDYDAIQQQAQQVQSLLDQVAELTARLQAAEAELSGLRAQEEEFRSLKSHIAEIEINAHRRTEEFRAAAVGQLREMIDTQRAWCDQARAQYTEVSEQFAQKLLSAQQSVSSVDFSTFDQFQQQLQQ